MADCWLHDSTRRAKAALIDSTVANPARVGDHMSGGRNNFEADRRAARAMVAASPIVTALVPAMRAFHQRVVRYLVAEAGIRQFLDIGTRLDMSGNTHEVAQSLAPECRIVYVASDPMVLSHARSLAMSTADGAVAAVGAAQDDPGAILACAGRTLDLGRPVAILLMATLAFVLDDAAAAEIMASLTGAVAVGSHVALHHQASDLGPEIVSVARRWNAMSDRRITLRSRGQLAGLLRGLDPVPPGLVPIDEWRPEPSGPHFGHAVPLYGVVARKRCG
jgi:S-adenosyl methyltransferase